MIMKHPLLKELLATDLPPHLQGDGKALDKRRLVKSAHRLIKLLVLEAPEIVISNEVRILNKYAVALGLDAAGKEQPKPE